MKDSWIAVDDDETLQTRWDALRQSAYVLLEGLAGMFQVQFVDAGNYYTQENAVEFRRNLPESLSAEMKRMQVNLAEFSAQAITAAKSSVLASAADQAGRDQRLKRWTRLSLETRYRSLPMRRPEPVRNRSVSLLEVYLPMQNLLKMRFRMSSLVVVPVRPSRAWRAS
jgi:hypothetical protein